MIKMPNDLTFCKAHVLCDDTAGDGDFGGG